MRAAPEVETRKAETGGTGEARDPEAGGLDPFALAALLVALDPHGLGGAVLEGPGGPAPEAWLATVRRHRPLDSAWRKIPVGITPDRMVGGLDLTASLKGGTRVLRAGVLAEAHGGVVVLPSAERLQLEVAAPLLEALDRGRVTLERDGLSSRPHVRVGVVLLDEAMDDEPGAPAALRDRTAFLLRLPPRWQPHPDSLPGPDAITRARDALPRVEMPEATLHQLAQQAAAGGWSSHRPLLLAARTARALAALLGEPRVTPELAALAGALVLVPRGAPGPQSSPPADGEAADDPDQADGEADDQIDDQADGEAHAEDSGAADEEASGEEDESGEEASRGAGQQPEPDPPPDGNDAGDDAGDDTDADAGDDADPDDEPPMQGLPADLIPQVVRALLPQGFTEDAGRTPGSGGRGLRATGGGRGDGGIRSTERGRRVGAEPGLPRRGRRLDLPATLRAAAPWQRLRARMSDDAQHETRHQAQHEARAEPQHETRQRIHLTTDDLHVQKRIRPALQRTLFVVDASGSQALRRMGEVKGAVELLLADSYRRREEVALVVFRDRDAQVVVPPTRSLTRARRLLRGLAGGGGTPLARGLETTLHLIEQARREGVDAQVVLLSDGRPNVDRAGRGSRSRARSDALALALEVRRTGVTSRVLDTSPRGERFLEELARHLGTRAHHLPFADARAIRRAARS